MTDNEKLEWGIDYRIANILRDNLKDLESWIQQETNKAGYILWFQWTILFIASMKIGNNIDVWIKIAIVVFFLLSATISFLTIASEWKIKHLNILHKRIFDRKQAVKEMRAHYETAQKLFFKKIRLNNINMILQMCLLLAMLVILLFGK